MIDMTITVTTGDPGLKSSGLSGIISISSIILSSSVFSIGFTFNPNSSAIIFAIS